MLRLLLQFLLPLVLPFLAYLIYAYFAGRGRLEGPWIALTAAGLGLVALSLITWGLLGGAEPGKEYIPARMDDGRLVPGTTTEPEPATQGQP